MKSNDDPREQGKPQVRNLCFGVAGAVFGMAVLLAGVLVVAGRADWWRGYAAATVAAALAAGASLVPLAWGVRRGSAVLVQMFMVSGGVRAVVALGIGAVAVGVGRYPAIPTFGLLLPYYLAVLAVETACLAAAAKSGN